MKLPEYFIAGYFVAGADQLSPKKWHDNQKPSLIFAIDDFLDFFNTKAIMTDGFFDNAAENSTDSSISAQRGVGLCACFTLNWMSNRNRFRPNQKRGGPNSEPSGRKCLHCVAEKTLQWQTGPIGPKTLCSACGVWYKFGRLAPECRPAASPTFVSMKHSNLHRKVLELRRQKELQQQH